MFQKTLQSTSVNRLMCSWGLDAFWFNGLLFLIAAFLCSCSQLPEAPSSRIGVPAKWGEPVPCKGVAPGAAWWTIFRDPALSRLIAGALDAQPDLLLARAKADEAQAQTSSALARAWPVVKFEPSAWKSENSSNDMPNGVFRPFFTAAPYDRYLTPLSVSYAFDVFGRLRKEMDAIRMQECATEADVAAARLLMTGELSQTYFLVQSLALERALLARTVAERADEVQIQESLVQAGKANEQALARSRLELAQVRLDEAAMGAGLHAACHALAILAGKAPATFEAPPVRALPHPPGVPAGVPANILGRRPDLVAARSRLEGALAREEGAKRAYFPSIQLTALGGYASTDLSDLVRAESLAWTIGAGLTQTVFEGGLRKANIQAARARYEQAVAQYDSTLLTAFREVEDALSRLAFLKTEQNRAGEAEHAARELVEIALARYRDGLSPYDPVIDANHALLGISRRQIQIQRGLCDATVQLIVALGGGW